jgi:hypothetical protein
MREGGRRYKSLGKRRSSVIAMSESSSEEAIWARATTSTLRRCLNAKLLFHHQIASSVEDSFLAMTIPPMRIGQRIC